MYPVRCFRVFGDDVFRLVVVYVVVWFLDLILMPITIYLRFTFGGRYVLTLVCLLSFFNIFLLSVSVSPAREHYDCVRVLFPCTSAVSWLSY